MQFASFQASFPDYAYVNELREPSLDAITNLVADARSIAAQKMFDYAPLDLKAIAGIAPKPKNAQELSHALSELKPSSLEQRLSAFVTETVPDPKDESKLKKALVRRKALSRIALYYYLKTMVDSALPRQLPKTTTKPLKKEVRLAINTSEWTAVKKVATDGSAKNNEITAVLSSIHDTLSRKQAQTDAALEELVNKLGEPRKSVAALQTTLPIALNAPPEIKRTAFEIIMAACGYPPYIDTQTISDAWPELKIPKPRGNYGSKKKK